MILKVKNLSRHHVLKQGSIKAVENVSFEIAAGETFGLVGESGCGKSTLGKTLLRLQEPTSGEIWFEEANIAAYTAKELKHFRKSAQYIFQDPYASLNPRMMVEDIVSEPFDIHNIPVSKSQIDSLLHQVGLSSALRKRFPHEFSGGQRQRIGIARALALTPKFLVCDEPLSSLDVSIQAQIINLFKELQAELGLTYLFISHDLRMVKYLSTRVAVMYLGHLVEIAPTTDLYTTPLHPYTQALLSAVPIPDPKLEKSRTRIVLSGEIPSPIHPPKGCPFATRCPKAIAQCHSENPLLREVKPGHLAACHLLTGEVKR